MEQHLGTVHPNPTLNTAKVITETLKILISNAGSFFFINVLFLSPGILLYILSSIFEYPNWMAQILLAIGIWGCQGAVVYAVVSHVSNRDWRLADALRIGMGSFSTIFGISVLLGFLFFALMMVVGLLGFVGGAIMEPLSVVLGLVALGAFYLNFFVVIPVAVVEQHSITGSVERAVELMHGSRFRVTLAVVGSLILCFAIVLIGLFSSISLARWLVTNAWISEKMAYISSFGFGIGILMMAIVAPILEILPSVIYVQLCKQTSGSNTEKLSNFFEFVQASTMREGW